MTDHPLSLLLWLGVSLALAKIGPLLALLLRH